MDFVNKLHLYLRLLRWHQWSKNLFIFAALIFSAQFFSIVATLQTTISFFIFCLLASSVYIFNDLIDLESDRKHPMKSMRPLSSGKVSKFHAVVLLVLFLFSALVGAWHIGMSFFITSMSYVLLNVFYTLLLKHIYLVDVFAVSANYVLRIFAGTVAIQAPFTQWLFIASVFLALLLSLGKRRHEVMLLGNNSGHRETLKTYSIEFIDRLISIAASATIIVYALYAMDSHTRTLLQTDLMPLTIPLVLFGLFRYLHIIYQKSGGGDPSLVVFTDTPLLVTVVLWGVSVFCVIIMARLM